MVGFYGDIIQIWCKVCIRYKKVISFKLNSFYKHVGCHKTLAAMPRVKVGDNYFLKTNVHVINE
jgi:hypothetical protein